MDEASARDAHDLEIELARVRAAGQVLALDIRAVREIVRGGPTAPLPGAPPAIEGVIDLRGSVIPVVDLDQFLGRPSASAGTPSPASAVTRSRIVVVECDGLVFGLRVSGAEDVIRVSSSRVEPLPPLARQAGCSVVEAMVRCDGAPPLPVLSLDALRAELAHGSAPSAEFQRGRAQ